MGCRPVDKVSAMVNRTAPRGQGHRLRALPAQWARHRDGTLYIAELSQISKIDQVEDHLDDPPEPVVIDDDLPKGGAFGSRFIAIGPDDRLYIASGALQLLPRAHTTARSGGSISTAPAPNWSRGACATPSVSTGTRRSQLIYRKWPRLALRGSSPG